MPDDPFQKKIDEAIGNLPTPAAGTTPVSPPPEPPPTPMENTPSPTPTIPSPVLKTEAVEPLKAKPIKSETEKPKENPLGGLASTIKGEPASTPTPPTPPIIPEEKKQVDLPPIEPKSKSVIIDKTGPKKENGKPPEYTGQKPKTKSKSKAPLIVSLLLLIFTLPVAIYYGSQTKFVQDLRSRAVNITTPCRVCSGTSCVKRSGSCNSDYDQCSLSSDCGGAPVYTYSCKVCSSSNRCVKQASTSSCSDSCSSDSECGWTEPSNTPPLYSCEKNTTQTCTKNTCSDPGSGTCPQGYACCKKAAPTPTLFPNNASCSSDSQCASGKCFMGGTGDGKCIATDALTAAATMTIAAAGICQTTGAPYCRGNYAIGNCYTTSNGYICRDLRGNMGVDIVTNNTRDTKPNCTCPPGYPWMNWENKWVCWKSNEFCTPTDTTAKSCGLSPGEEPVVGCAAATPTGGGGGTNPTNTPVGPTNTTGPSSTPTDIPTSTLASTATETPTNGPSYCDASCGSDSDCPSGLTCATTSESIKRCRNSACTSQTDCVCPEGPTNTPIPGVTYYPTSTSKQYAYVQPTSTTKVIQPTSVPGVISSPTPTAQPTPKVPVAGVGPGLYGILAVIGGILLLTLGLAL